MIEELTTLSLQNSNKVAIIDKDKFEILSRYNWKLDTNGYVYTTLHKRTLRLHVFLNGKFTDHKDRNPLHNFKSNLRKANASQNGCNRNKNTSIHTSKYKGVSYCTSRQVWRAAIYVNKNRIYLGSFKEEIKAAQAYNKAAELYHKQFAVLNVL